MSVFYKADVEKRLGFLFYKRVTHQFVSVNVFLGDSFFILYNGGHLVLVTIKVKAC